MGTTIKFARTWAAPGILAAAVVIATPAAQAAVAPLDAWANVHSSAPSNASGTVTSSALTVSAGTQRLFVVAAVLEVGTSNATMSAFSASFGGVTMHPVTTTAALSSREHAGMWYLLDSEIPAGSQTIAVTYTVSANTVTGIHTKWGSYTGVDQTTPINGLAANASAATSVTFGAAVNYAANGLTLYATGNGGSPATMTPPTDFTTQSGATTTTSAHSSFVGVTGVHGVSGSYPAGTAVAFGGTTSGRSAIVVASLRPGSNNSTTAGTVTATASTTSCTAITVGATYTGDANANNTLSYRYRTPSGSGAWQGPFTRAHSASPYGFDVTGLSFGAAYDVEVTYVDSDGVTGTATQTVSNVTVGANCTGAGTAAATQTTGATPSLALSAPYTNDANANNTLSYRYRTPSGTGAWSTATNLPHTASPYTATLSGLTCGATYDVEVTYNDANGIGSGTQVQTISGILMSNCTLAGTVTATGGSCGSISVTAPYTQDADADNALSYRYRTPAGTGAWTTPTALSHSTSPYSFTIPGLAAGSYDVEVTYADPDGVGGTATQTVNNLTVTASCTTAGTATATPSSCTQVTVSAPFSGDSNLNGSVKVEYNTTNTWPGTTACAAVTGASPRTCAITPLANATSYYFRVTYSDGDGVVGTNPQVLGPTSTLDCRVTPDVPTAVADACSQVTVTLPYTGDADGDSRTSVNRGTSAGGPFGTAVCANLSGASPRSCVDSTVAATTTYYYQVTFTDPDGVVGSATQVTSAVATPACAVVNTTAGALSALAASCNSVNLAATFIGDQDGDGSTLFEYNTSNTWPGTTACSASSGASPRQCLVGGLTANTTYWFRATFSDPDGVAGTNPTATVSAATAATCGGDTQPPTITVLVPARNAIVAGADVAKVQLWDSVGLAATNPLQWQLDSTLSAGFGVAGLTQNTNYNCGSGCRVYEIALPSQAAGSHYLALRATDASGNAALVTWAFRSQPAGAGTLLRRTTSSQLCLDCHNIQTHNSQYTTNNYGNWSIDCLGCHTPHDTTNIFLVRGSIDTPTSGTKAIDFRNRTGVAANSYATPAASPNPPNPPGMCEVCHTRTKNSDNTPRARNNAWTDWTKHYPGTCTGCHPHAKGFGAGESEGAATCSGCHRTIWEGMTGAVAKATKHTLGNVLGTNDSFNDTNVTWGNPLSGNAASVRSCVNMCHNDHPHTLTSPVTATHENNAYLDATSQASRAAGSRTSTDKDKTDFESAAANGGMCLSCHRNPVDATHPAIDQAGYTASGHNTTVTATRSWYYTQHDGSNFLRNCTKCHADRNDARPTATTIPFGAVHYSDYASLLAGSTNPNGAPATFVCYNCHGNGTVGVDNSGKNIASQIAKARNHPSNADNVHATVTEDTTAAFGNTLGVSGRHANCIDCHEPHKARVGTHATPGNLAGPPLEGAWGAQLSTNPAFWTDTAAANFTKKALVAGTDVEATLCFKCHSRYYWGTTALSGRGVPPAAPSGGTYTTGTAAFTNGSATVTGTGTTWTAAHVGWVIRNNANGTWYLVTGYTSATSLTISPAAAATAAASAYTLQMAETDVAKEFSPANVGNFAGTWASGETAGGFHPVLAAAGSNLGAVRLANLVTTNQPWSTTVRNLMTCTDCHESETAADPNGPHGSTAGFLLKGPNTGWSATTTMGTAGMPTGTFCANCHSATFANSRFTQHYSRSDHRVACWNCHAAVPHGGPRPGMLVAGAGANANVGGPIAGWDTASPYQGLPTGSNSRLYLVSYPANNTTNWSQNNCGCNGTGH